MKKKILFMMPYVNCGGVETTLVSLLSKLNSDLFDIDLLLIEKNGKFISKIPSYVNIKYLNIPKSEWGVFYGYKRATIALLKNFDLINLIKIMKKGKFKLSENRKDNVEYFCEIDSCLEMYEKEYDIAVDYFGYATFTTYYVAKKIRAKKKITWIHSRFSTIGAKYLEEYYQMYDKILAVSKSTLSDFLSCTNIDKNKCTVFYNFIDYEKIRKLADEPINDINDKEIFKICSVGRLEKEKGFDLAIKVAKKLKNLGYSFCWYIVGEGGQRKVLEQYILEYDLKGDFKLLGLKDNPYPYIKMCDIYVQPSRYEGYCTTTNEARVLAKPIITTNVFGANEQFIDGENGFITEFDENQMTESIIRLINDSNERKMFSNNLKSINFNYDSQIELFNEI